MSAIPVIPDDVPTLEKLDAWIDRNAPKAYQFADRLRMQVAVMDRASEIGRAMRGEHG